VLLGDYLLSRAFRLAASTGDAVACELIGHATDLTCAGELHQIAVGRDRSKSERDYFRVIRGKTGQLFGLSCRLGARVTQSGCG
jgi:octaprenyl-diphosphate synthase